MMVSLSQTTMKGMKVNLPVGASGQTQSKKDYVSLSVDKDGYTYFDKEKIALEEVLPRLRKVYATNPEAKIFIRGDRDAVHGNVTRVLDQIRSSGFNKISFEIKSQATSGIPGAAK
jgi:biopolymer transport protein ExbD